jgi:hypothetical protein
VTCFSEKYNFKLRCRCVGLEVICENPEEVRSYFATVRQSVSLGVEHSCGICDQLLCPVRMLLSEICGLVSVRREDGSAICNAITQWSESRRSRK